VLDSAADWSGRSGLIAILLIAACYAAGLAMHYRWTDRDAFTLVRLVRTKLSVNAALLPRMP